MVRRGETGNEEYPQGPAEILPRSWKTISIAAWHESGKDNLALVSAGVAFYAFLAFVPFLTAFVLSYGLVADPASVIAHMESLTGMMPQNAARIIGDQLHSMTETPVGAQGLGLLAALAIALYGAAKGAGSIMVAPHIADDVERERRGLIGGELVGKRAALGQLLRLLGGPRRARALG